MRKFYTLLVREVRSYFHSPIAYVVLVFFLLVSGVDFYFQVSFMNQRPASYSVQEAFFNSVFFWFAFVLIFPLITMRLFAEEFKLGTIEPLMTAPVRDLQVVLAKFFGALVFYILLWIPTLLYFWIFQKITQQPAANSSGAYWGSYLMLLLLGMFYLSVGCLASVVTKNQIVIPREARQALRVKPGDKILVVVRGERVLVLQKPKSHHAAIRGLAQGRYPKDHLQKEHQSWE